MKRTKTAIAAVAAQTAVLAVLIGLVAGCQGGIPRPAGSGGASGGGASQQRPVTPHPHR